MSELKWAKDNKGDVAVTDGNVYVGFAGKDIDESYLDLNINNYASWSDEQVKKLGIDKITEWKDIEL